MKAVKLTPKKGKTYKNRSGSEFRCLMVNNTTAVMSNITSGWTFIAHNIYQYEDGTIEWDYSTGGQFVEIENNDLKAKRLIEALKSMQEKGERFPCPRCGQNNMSDNPVRNALSRHADVYICDKCGTDEAMRDFARIAIPLNEWAICR